MKQTAVEWLEEQLLTKYHLKIDNYQEFNKAKQMEKQQIIDAYSNNGWNDQDERADAEQYYNETYSK
jgi:hypothetical protein